MRPIYIVDAFASRPFGGNPAAVCLLDSAADGEWMQKVAAEMNLPETAFLYRDGEVWQLRWFSPEQEVDLCGHATLAAAHTLWEAGRLPSGDRAIFSTRSGLLTATGAGDGWITLDFPAEPSVQTEAPEALIQALGLIPRYTGRNRFDYVVEVDGERTVRELKPDLALLRTLDARGVVVTARSSTDGFDFISRAFYPAVGIPEDPVTGSAHCALSPYWGKRLRKDSLTGYQASARGGQVKTENAGDRVRLSGQAVTVLKGTLEV